MKRTVSTVCVLGALLLGASAAQAANANACWNRALERMDYLADPPEHGDNNFFTTVVAQTGNVTLLYPAKQSMLEFTQRLYRIRVDKGGPTPTGCGNEYLNGLNYFMPTDVAAPAGAANLQGHYNPSTTYPDPETTYTNGGSHDRSDGFTSNKFYQYQQWPAEDSGTAQTDNAACTRALGATSSSARPAWRPTAIT